MEDDVTVYDFATPVHRVLLEPNQMLGIGVAPATAILVVTIVLMNMVSVWCAGIGAALFVVARALCRKDPYMLAILMERLTQPTLWRAG